ncbi:FtsX-like permease family protein [Succinimonas sp.]|uniref:FtsX-like permease family protein n=1 Tax=Succinimonas sp. TaxID=1936151 RepID=UPI00386E43B0
MHKLLPALIGFRFSSSGRKTMMSGFISKASAIGAAIGVIAILAGLSAMNGFERELRYRVLGVIPAAEIYPVEGEYILGVSEKTRILAESPAVAAAAPEIIINGLVSAGGVYKGVQVRAVDPQAELEVLHLSPFIREGSFLAADNNSAENPSPENHSPENASETEAPGIVLGSRIARKLGVKIGDSAEFLMAAQKASESRDQSGPRALSSARFRVTGILEIGGQLDAAVAFININEARKLLDLPEDSANNIAFRTADILQAGTECMDGARYLAQRVSAGNLYVRSWMSVQGRLYKDIQMIRSILYLALFLVISVACFNIVSSLIMAVNDKRSEVAILLSMGYSRLAVMETFAVQGAISGCAGTLAGIILGVPLAVNLSEIVSGIEHVFGFHVLNQNVYFIGFVPTEFHWQDAVYVAGIAVIMSFMATVIPAIMASKIKPARELSGK